MIKAFLFDWGGVMSDGGRGGLLEDKLSKSLNIPPEEAFKLIGRGWEDYKIGKIDEKTFWQLMEKDHGAPIAQDKRQIWNTWEEISDMPEMTDLVRKLKKDGYQVGVVSDTIPNTASEIRAHGGYDVFDFEILSFEVGYAKPDPMIYKIAMDYLPGVKPSEIVFIDDTENRVAAAKELGMQTIFAKTKEQVIKDVNELLTLDR
jgi:epoxide hydrolase-like predicted phosphatase